MHIFGYIVIGFLTVSMLLAATKALSHGAGCTGNNAITASADVGSDIAAAKPNGPHARAIAKTRGRGGGLTKHAGLGSPRFGNFAVQPQGE
jgi:hypothetical protein